MKFVRLLLLCSLAISSSLLSSGPASILFGESSHLSSEPLVFCGPASQALGEQVAYYLGHPLGKAKIDRFNDGESRIQILDNVRNRDVFVLESTCACPPLSVNDRYMELFLMIRTLKRASAQRVTVIMPYYGYARQDRKSHPRVPISASDVAMLLETAGADRVIAVDLHCGQIQGFFHHAPVDNLYASTVFVPYMAQLELVDPVVVSPDAGGVERAKRFRDGMEKRGVDADLAVIVKQRSEAGKIDTMSLIGSVEGCDAIIIDDICDTAGTLCKAAAELKGLGAKRVFACITHPVFSGPALERIASSEIDRLVVTDTIPLHGDISPNIKQLSIAGLLAEAIHRTHEGDSLSALFDLEHFNLPIAL
ncbi:MAG: ribose-phosphate pyrophosphokinase, partial [Chlamydiia bacterium]|nr:ribose-phosphate pyrophosphokinase [Chlamydiia bacterium]